MCGRVKVHYYDKVKQRALCGRHPGDHFVCIGDPPEKFWAQPDCVLCLKKFAERTAAITTGPQIAAIVS